MSDNFAMDPEAGRAPEEAPRRLVMAADDDRRALERELHRGLQQHLVAVALSLQLVEQAVGTDSAAVKSLLEDMRRDVQQANEAAMLLAQRIYPASLELGGLGALLRSAVVSARVPATVEVEAGPSCPPEVAMTIYLFWLALLNEDGSAAVRIRERENALAFELTGKAASDLSGLEDRVEALGGRVAIEREPGGGLRVSGSLPCA
jgi:signal transduction histidine kinase